MGKNANRFTVGIGFTLLVGVMTMTSITNEFVLLGFGVVGFGFLVWGGWGLIRPDVAAKDSEGLPSANDLTAWQALDYLRDESDWGCLLAWQKYSLGGWDWLTAPPGMRHFVTDSDMAGELVEAAKRGEVEIWGRRQYTTEYEKIDRRFWETSGLDIQAYFAHTPKYDLSDGGRTEPKKLLARNATIYVGLRIDHDQMARRWPRASKFDRLVTASMGVEHG